MHVALLLKSKALVTMMEQSFAAGSAIRRTMFTVGESAGNNVVNGSMRIYESMSMSMCR